MSVILIEYNSFLNTHTKATIEFIFQFKLNSMKYISTLVFWYIFSIHYNYGQGNNQGFCDFENIFPHCYDEIPGIPCSGWSTTEGGTIRVVIHLIKRQNCTGGLNNDQVTNMINTLSSDFNQFGIYINVICIRDLCNDDFYSDPRPYLPQLYQTNVYPDAFNLYIQDQLLDGLQGNTSVRDPSNKLWACYSPSFKIVSHELGHQLGLAHTSTCVYGYECVPRNNSNAWEAGDRICDTDADPGLGIDECMIEATNYNDKNDHWACNPRTAPNCSGIRFQTPIFNIMRAISNECQTIFTEGQGERMRQAIQCKENEAYQGDGNISVESSQTWQDDKTFDVDLLIKSGVTLTINSTVRMATNRKILLEGGATIIVDGGKLTKGNTVPYCGSEDTGPFWRGVQLGYPGTSGRAYIYFTNNATMEYSYHGCYNVIGSLGYVSIIGNSNFFNNRTAIEAMSATSTGMWVLINNSKFEINSLYPGTDIYHQIRLGGGRALISNSTIENLTSIDASGIAAIQEINCLLTLNDCEKIKGYYYGVDAMAGGSMPYSISNSIFQNLYTCIRSRGVNSFSIKNNNQFKINGFGSQSSGVGLELNKGSKFTINGNQFINQDQLNIKNDGIKIFDTHPSDENYISKDNVFTRLSRGISTEFGQGNIGLNKNLYFTCNDFVQCSEDIKLGSNTSINNIQRFGSSATGNTLSQLPNNTTQFFNNTSLLDLAYWYNSNNASEYLERKFQVTPVPKPRDPSIERCYIAPPPCPLCPQRDDQYNQLVIDINVITGQLNQLLDGGQTSYWISTVENGNSSNSSEIYMSLSNLSPNMSSSLMIAFWQRTDIFTVEQRIQLLQNNLALIENSDFRKFFLDNSSDISPITITSILESTPLESSRIILERLKRQKQLELNWVISIAIQDLYNVEVEDLNAVLVWYDRIGSLDAKMDKAMYQLHALDFSNLQITMTQIQGLNGLDSFEILDKNDFINLMTLLISAYNNNRYEGNLNESELENLNGIANSGNTRSAQFAVNILKFYYDIDPQENQPLVGSNIQSPAIGENVMVESIKFPNFISQIISIYPNPASDRILIKCKNGIEFKVSIYDIVGNLHYVSKNALGNNSLNISTQGWKKGLYFVRVETNNSFVETNKLILK